jgi:hypothetical protein
MAIHQEVIALQKVMVLQRLLMCVATIKKMALTLLPIREHPLMELKETTGQVNPIKILIQEKMEQKSRKNKKSLIAGSFVNSRN